MRGPHKDSRGSQGKITARHTKDLMSTSWQRNVFVSLIISTSVDTQLDESKELKW